MTGGERSTDFGQTAPRKSGPDRKAPDLTSTAIDARASAKPSRRRWVGATQLVELATQGDG